MSLCGMCHALAVTEGQIPKYCSSCDPPRLRPEAPSTGDLQKRMREHYTENPPGNDKN